MFFRFERQTLGRPAHANPAHFAAGADRLSALCRSLIARRMRRSASAFRKRPAERAERAERALTRKRRRNQWGADVQTDGGNWRKPAETPRMTGTASRLSRRWI